MKQSGMATVGTGRHSVQLSPVWAATIPRMLLIGNKRTVFSVFPRLRGLFALERIVTITEAQEP